MTDGGPPPAEPLFFHARLQTSGLAETGAIWRQFGDRVARARRDAGLTQRELGERIGLTLAQVVKLEEGHANALPLLARIGEAVGQPFEFFGLGALDAALGSSTTTGSVPHLEARSGSRTGPAAEGRIAELEQELVERDRRIAELTAELERLAAAPSTRATEPALRAPRAPPAVRSDRPASGSRRSPPSQAVVASVALGLIALVAVAGYLLFDQGRTSEAGRLAPVSITPEVSTPVALPRTREAAVAPAPRVPARPAPAILPRAKTAVLVLNGNGVDGAAARKASEVRRLGYPVSGVTDASRQDYPRSIVMYRGGLRAEARRLARRLHVRTVTTLEGLRARDLGRAKLVVIVGRR